jgi:FOG: PKD repeat
MKMNRQSTGLMTGLLVLVLLFSLIPTAVAASNDSGYIAVGAIPVPEFVGQPLRGKAPLTVQFNSTGSYEGAGSNPTYLWTFGDGTTSAEKHPSHTYTAVGNYTVSLKITNTYGNATETKTNYIYVGSGVVADFTADKTTGPSPLAVKFTDKSSGNPTKYVWDFGDGSTSSEKNPSHTYNKTGTYTVSLTVSNEFGQDTKTSTSLITVGNAPYVFFTANGTINSHEVVFTTHGTVDASTVFKWDFGDGTTSAERNPTHIYKSTGVYNVTMTVSNTYGTYNYTLKNVSITDTLKADFSATNNMGSAPLNVKFTDTSIGSGANSSFLWNFGDGTTSTERNPTHTYNRTGTYTVALTVTNPCGATNSTLKSDYVSVGNVPVADFVGVPTNGVSPLNVQFTDKSQGDGLTYAWDFGDGATSAEKNPKHTYTKEGTYTVKLTVKNSYGTNTATKDKYITVGAPPRADFQADVLSGIAPHPVQFTDQSTGNPTTWYWDFGDGGTSTEKNPRHTYAKSGYYDVTLTVKNAYGESQLLRLDNGVKIWKEDQKAPEPEPPVETPTNTTNNTTNNTTEKDKSAIPGFGLIFAIAAIAGLVGIGAYQRKRKQ